MDAVTLHEKSLTQIVDLLENLFGLKCEVALHDWSQPYDSTLVDIRNGHITGRTVGDCGSNLGLEVMRGTVRNGDKFNYITHTRDGKILRSSTIYLRDQNDKVRFALCVNLDITETLKFENYLHELNQYQINESEPEEVFVKNVSDLLDYFLQKGFEHAGKDPGDMNKDDKMRMLEFLDRKGAFLISKSNKKICEALNISKFTLYNYLDQIHSAASGEEDNTGQASHEE